MQSSGALDKEIFYGQNSEDIGFPEKIHAPVINKLTGDIGPMKIERTKNATRNITFGLLLKLYDVLMPFLMRTAMIYFMGVQYSGLNNLFTSILQVLNLMELGVGSAMVYSMYKPIAQDDEASICALMRLYRTYYRVIGLVIAVAGLALTPFIPKLIKSDLPAGLNIYTLYLLNLSATVLSYWLFAYKNSLLHAHQRTDVVSKVRLAADTAKYAAQFFTLIFLRNYYAYVIANLASQALTNVLTAVEATKMYPRYKPMGKLPRNQVRDINHRVRDLFTSKLGHVIVNSADTIVISAFLGLTMLAVYQNYYFILSAIIGFLEIIFSACMAGIGNSIIVETKAKNFGDLKKFSFLICWIAGFCTVCLLCLFQPFMEIWMGKNLMLDFSVVICLCVYFFIYEIGRLLNTYKDAAGIWHEDRFRPLVTALSNLAMNLVMVQFWGIYGVILSTVLSTALIGTPWLLHNLFTVLFDKHDLLPYLKQLLFYAVVTAVGCVATYWLCSLVPLERWPLLIVRGIICCIVPNLIFFGVYHALPEYRESLALVDKMTKGKLRRRKTP